MPPSQVTLTNHEFIDRIRSGDPRTVKEAQDTVNEYTRVKAREDGFLRKILPPIPLSDDELDRQVDTDNPVKVVDREPGSPAAYQVPFATSPMGTYIRGDRYRVMMSRFMTHEFSKDVAQLRNYNMDIRKVISDNAIKDVLAEEDRKFIFTCNRAMGGAVNAVSAATGEVQWTSTNEVISRDSVADAAKVMRRLPSDIAPSIALISNVSVLDILKWGRDEAGGDLSQDLLLKGFVGYNILGLNWITTIKKALVPENTIFFFAEPQFLGKFYTMDDITMFMETRAFMINFFAYELMGAAIGNVSGVTRTDFADEGSSD